MSADLFGLWVPTLDRLPANPPGFPNDDHVACLCIWEFEMRLLQWNAHYKVWDDHDGDDFFCDAQEVSYWMPLPAWPDWQNATPTHDNK